ncbi:MAG TPA: heavy-metal-associated domain-containing protein [Candidatus Obscuribacterales bacterium]
MLALFISLCWLLLPPALTCGPSASESKPATKAHNESRFSRVDFQVRGSTCVACIRRVAKKLQSARGVVLADVSIFKPYPAVLVYDRSKTNFQEIRLAVKDEPVRFEQVEESALSTVPAVVLPRSVTRQEALPLKEPQPL